MSCVKWHIGLLDTSPRYEVGISESAPVFTASATLPLLFELDTTPALGLSLALSASPKIQVGILCKAGLERWLEVTPDEVAWLTEDNGWSYDYAVSSNLQWTIE